jgi:propanol-preferring alcohol dehydrogenase
VGRDAFLGALPFACAMTIPYWASAVELIEVLDLARQGTIRAHAGRFPLEHVKEAHRQLREATLDRRAVVVPNLACASYCW